MKNVRVLFLLVLPLGLMVLSCKGTSNYIPPDVGRVDLFFNMDKSSPVLGTDYEQFEGTWAVKDGVLEFRSYPPADGVESMESKIHFFNTQMANGKVELDVLDITGFTNAEGNGDNQGNVGFLFRAGDFKPGADNVRGYYVGVGKNEAKDWIVSGSYYAPGWNPIWTNNIEGEPPFHLAVTMINGEVTAVVTSGSKEVYNEKFQTSEHGSLVFGDVGLRTWIADGKVDNIKITNIGSGLDYEK